jgi:hypothetical protein
MFRLKILDYFAIFLSLAIILLFTFTAFTGDTGEPMVHIQAAEGEYYYPLEVNRRIIISGPIGDTVIIIENGTVHVEDSPCADKLCVKAGHLDEGGEWTACMPNRVFLRVEGSRSSDIDALSY